MREERILNVYLLPQGPAGGEWASLLGDKYFNALPFKWELTENVEEAQVFVWEGAVTPKSEPVLKKVEELLKQGERVLLLQPVAQSLMKDYSFTRTIDLEQVRYIELPSGSLLPEDLLWGLDECQKKLKHV